MKGDEFKVKRIEQGRPNQNARLDSPEVEESIRRRAYEIYEQRGKTDGLEIQDWLQAEKEVLRKKEVSRAA